MLKRDDIVDLIMQHLRPAVSGSAPSRAASERPSPTAAEGPRGRVFLSEYEIKRMLTRDASELKIPQEAILSPLASDWLVLKGIKIVRE